LFAFGFSFQLKACKYSVNALIDKFFKRFRRLLLYFKFPKSLVKELTIVDGVH